MHPVTPEVYIIGGTAIDEDGLLNYLTALDVPQWSTDAPDGPTKIIEIMSRGCYQSYGVGLNPNVTRVRDGNRAHLRHILAVNHGSVLEHAVVNFKFRNVSRVFTHELVRHRVGVAISQESLRYVRLTDLGQWVPPCFQDDVNAMEIMDDAFAYAERAYQDLLGVTAIKEGVDNFNDLPDSKKKEYTSAARRVAPIGLATEIGWSCNMRELLHIIRLRTDPSSEEEMQLVFGMVKDLMVERFPNVFNNPSLAANATT